MAIALLSLLSPLAIAEKGASDVEAMATGVDITGNTHCGDAMVSEESATSETAGTRYRVNSTSQYGGIPFLLNKRNMTVLGEYVSYSNFTAENGEDFSVASASLSRGRGRCWQSARADH